MHGRRRMKTMKAAETARERAHRPSLAAWWRRPARRHNRYRGVRASPIGRIANLPSASVDPRYFYDHFVRRRRPCVINEMPVDMAAIMNSLWTSRTARELNVQVEVRDGPTDAFGKGRHLETTFGTVLDDQSTNMYLTTQEVPEGQLVAAPLTAIADTLPIRPELLGKLVPQSINLWLGRSTAPASSGLHHDFHDNLYVLLRGRKRFRLFSPADAHKMYTHGRLRCVHPNGRINYVSHSKTTADGRELEDLAAGVMWRAQRVQKRAEARLERAEVMSQQAVPGAQEAIEDAEERLDIAMDRLASARAACNKARRKAAGRRKRISTSTSHSKVMVNSDSSPPERNAPPPSFSQIADLTRELERLRHKGAAESDYPLLAEATMMECELTAGQMLYLPAGWFHEVSSNGSDAHGSADGSADGGLHCAVNYWYHPPQDSLSGGSFECPHGHIGQMFWEREFKREWARAMHSLPKLSPCHT